MTVTLSYALLELKLIQKILFLLKMKARSLGKGHQRLIRGPAGGGWIFSEFDYRHLVELRNQILVYQRPPYGTFSKLLKFTTQNCNFGNFEANFQTENTQNVKI